MSLPDPPRCILNCSSINDLTEPDGKLWEVRERL